MNHQSPNEWANAPSWSDIQFFLAMVDSGSLRGAATQLGVSINSVRARIENLERSFDAVLLTRHRHGIELTEDGRRLLEIAERMRQAARQFSRSFGTDPDSASGHVHLAVTEGLGTYWMMPRLAELLDRHPGLKVTLTCNVADPDLSRLDCDLSVQLSRPENPDVVAVRIGYMHVGFFTSDRYVARHGMPQTMADLADHVFVEQATALLPRSFLAQATGADIADRIRLSVNTSSAHAMALSRDVGIGILPTYAPAISRRAVPILPEFHHRVEIWLAYNAEAEKLKRVRNVIDWVRQVFDGRRYPWFREDYVPPEDLAEIIKDNEVLFEGFRDD